MDWRWGVLLGTNRSSQVENQNPVGIKWVIMGRQNKNHRLTLKQLRAVVLLSQGEPIDAVADQLGVCRNTISNWKARDNFRRALTDYSNRIIDATFSDVLGKVGRAIDYLASVQKDAKQKTSDRIRAAVAIINTGLKAYEVKKLLAVMDRMKDFEEMFQRTRRHA
jgi:hypothetical protein